MSIRHGLLALLTHGAKHGYQLRHEFEYSTRATWSLNVGQVYSTLSRLERDGLISSVGTDEDTGGRDRVSYEITQAGRDEVHRWFSTPVSLAERPRNELAVKIALAATSPGVNVHDVVQAQRTASIRALQDYTRLKRDGQDEQDVWMLVLDAMIFQIEAEIRWLDHCEASVARLSAREKGTTAADAAENPDGDGREVQT